MTTILQKIPGAINALQLALKSAVQPQSVCSLNAITANPLRALPFALLFGKDQPDKK
jgi:hypothetical protein